MTTPADTDAPPLRGIFKAQLEGMLRWYRGATRDYAACLKDKAVADRACTTWEETVDRAMDLAREYGVLLATARELAPDLLTDADREAL